MTGFPGDKHRVLPLGRFCRQTVGVSVLSRLGVVLGSRMTRNLW